MSKRYECDGCGCDVTTGSRITVSSEGFEWGSGVEHFCSAACLVGRYDASAGIDNLLMQYKRIKISRQANRS
jgi:hypothetical protein